MIKFPIRILSASILLGLAATVHAGTPASPQATPLPLNIPVIGNVQVSGSDARASDFNANWMPKFQQIVNDNLSESVVFSSASGFKLDASKLFLRTTASQTIRVYFIGEGAGYLNTLGFAFTPAGSPTPGSPRLIFPNASSSTSKTRTVDAPLRVGDFVDIGVGGNGWQLDFFLLSNGFSTWRSSGTSGQITWLWNDKAKNSDAIQHVVAFIMPNSPYILIGFEDLIGGGDLDFNDLLFVVDIGQENAQNLTNEFANLPQ